MKNRIIISVFTFFIFWTLQLSAQDLKIGAKGGLNVASFGGDFVDVGPRAGFHLGLYGNREQTDRVNLQAELLYSLQGVKIEDEDIRVNLSYINIPLLAQVKLPEIVEGLSAHGGLQFGFLLSANEKGTFRGNTVDLDIKDDFKGLDASFVIGAGYEMESGLNFGLRYNAGLNDINNQTDEDADAKVNNQVFQIWVAYLLWSN